MQEVAINWLALIVAIAVKVVPKALPIDVAATHVACVFGERRPIGLFAINTGYQLISLLIMGAILATWT
jgi:hypothetical protein